LIGINEDIYRVTIQRRPLLLFNEPTNRRIPVSNQFYEDTVVARRLVADDEYLNIDNRVENVSGIMGDLSDAVLGEDEAQDFLQFEIC